MVIILYPKNYITISDRKSQKNLQVENQNKSSEEFEKALLATEINCFKGDLKSFRFSPLPSKTLIKRFFFMNTGPSFLPLKPHFSKDYSVIVF